MITMQFDGTVSLFWFTGITRGATQFSPKAIRDFRFLTICSDGLRGLFDVPKGTNKIWLTARKTPTAWTHRVRICRGRRPRLEFEETRSDSGTAKVTYSDPSLYVVLRTWPKDVMYIECEYEE